MQTCCIFNLSVKIKNELDFYKISKNDDSDGMKDITDKIFLKYQEVWNRDSLEWKNIIKSEKNE